jgi:hypothetical protein
MPEGPQSSTRRSPIEVQTWARCLAGILGLAGLYAGIVATFTRDVEAGPVALIAMGSLFLIIALSGVLPTRIKIGHNEAAWEREIDDSVERIEQRLREVGVLLDKGGASIDNFLDGESPEDDKALAKAGLQLGAMSEEVRFYHQ